MEEVEKMKNFFTYFKIEWRYISWVVREAKKLPREEKLIKYLGMNKMKFYRKFKYLKSDGSDYIDFSGNRPINLDLLADCPNVTVSDYLPMEIDIDKVVDIYKELAEVVKILEEKENESRNDN